MVSYRMAHVTERARFCPMTADDLTGAADLAATLAAADVSACVLPHRSRTGDATVPVDGAGPLIQYPVGRWMD